MRGTALTVAPGVKWLRMPLPFQLDHINLWLLEDGEGWAIVDTGVGLDDVRALWEQIFAAELGGRPVTRVVLTHFHPDHVGNGGWLTERCSVEFWCTQAEFLIAHVAVQSTAPRHAEARARHYRRNGCDEPALASLARRGNHYPRLVPTLPGEFRCIREGEALAIGGRR